MQAHWPEFDLEQGLWSIEGERTKNGKPHLVPLSSQALAILRDLHKQSGGIGLVLPGRQPGKGISTGTLHESIKRNNCHGIAPSLLTTSGAPHQRCCTNRDGTLTLSRRR